MNGGGPTPATRLVAVIICLLAVAFARAARDVDADIRFADGVYRVRIDALIEAPLPLVHAVIADHRLLSRISPTVESAELLEVYEDGSEKRRTRIATCVLLFCFDFVMTERFSVGAEGDLRTRILPAESDFRGGGAHWQLAAADKHTTRLGYTSSREPRFWIPPLIGPLVMQKKLEREAATSMRLIEAEAQRLLREAGAPGREAATGGAAGDDSGAAGRPDGGR